IDACATTVDALVAPGGASGCVVDAHDAAIDAMVDDEYGRRLDPSETALRRCQETLAKFAGKYAETREKSILGCRKSLLAGRALFLDAARTQPLLDPLDCADEASAGEKIRLAAAAIRSKAIAIGGCDDAAANSLADACATSLDGLAAASGEAGCLVVGHALEGDALLAARP
ncbi:hypothetical protein KGQ64_18730, partial [bacterium]|nr:hypothetical protein [bacterium]